MFWQYEAMARDRFWVRKTIAISGDWKTLTRRVAAYLKKNPDHTIQYRKCLSAYRCEYGTDV
jgi:hypothetical protein